MFRQAVAGPGPSTLLFRFRLGSAARQCLVRRLHSSPLSSATPTAGPVQAQAQANRRKPTLQPNFEAEPASPNNSPAQITKMDPPLDAIDDYDYDPDTVTVYAPPPIHEFDIEGSLVRLRQGIEARSLDQVANEWSQIDHSQARDLVPDADYAAIARFVAGILNPPNAVRLGQLYVDSPACYGALAAMAVEAGARSHMTGLNELFLKLITWGRPTETPGLYTRFVARYRQIRGIRQSHLNHRDRNTRLAARIDAEGAELFQLLYIAALTQLNQFDSATVSSLLQFKTTMSWSNVQLEMKHIVRAANLSQSSDGFYQAFASNVKRHLFAIVCYHSSSLIQQIHKASHSNLRPLLELYDQVLAASTGPDRLLIPVQQWTVYVDRTTTSIALPAKVWAQFILGFCRLDAPQQVAKIINVDLLAVYGNNVPVTVLTNALQGVSWMKRDTHEKRLQLGAMANSIWDRIKQAGGDLDPDCIGQRLLQLSRFGQHQEAQSFYRDSRKQLQLGGHRGPTPTLDSSYVQALAERRKFDSLMAFLKTRVSEPHRLERRAHALMVSAILGSVLPYDQRRAAFTTLMSRKHPDIEIESITWGQTLLFMLEATGDIPKVIAFVARKEPAVNAGNFWSNVIQRVAMQGARRNRDVFHEAGIQLLERHLVKDTALSDLKQFWSFRYVCNAIAQSSDMNADDRHAMLLRTIDIIPEDRSRVRRSTIAAVVETSIQRQDGEGVSEAIYWFNQLESPYPVLFSTMVLGLFNHGQFSMAKQYAERAPAACPPAFWGFADKTFGIKRPRPERRKASFATLQETVLQDMQQHGDSDEAAMRAEDAKNRPEEDDDDDGTDKDQDGDMVFGGMGGHGGLLR